MKKLVLLLVILPISVCFAQDPVEKLEKKLFEETVERKKMDCMRAFGHNGFCECLCAELPWTLFFSQYIKIVISPKEELYYDTMTEDDKKLYYIVYSARNKCVEKAFSK